MGWLLEDTRGRCQAELRQFGRKRPVFSGRKSAQVAILRRILMERNFVETLARV